MKDEFLKQLKSNDTFVMNHFFYCLVPLKNAKLIYSCNVIDKDYPSLNSKLSLAGIYLDEKVYVILPYNIFTSDEIYSNTVFDNIFVNFHKFFKKIDKEVKKTFFERMDEMDLTGISNDNEKTISRITYDMIFNEYKINGYNGCSDRIDFPTYEISNEDVFSILIGDTTIDTLLDEFISDNLHVLISSEYDYRKAKKLKEIYKQSDVMKIYTTIAPLKIKTINVSFLKNGKTVSGKMKKEDLLGKIISIRYGNFYDFSSYDFITTKEGEYVLKTLQNDNYSKNDRHNCIYPDDIVKITYSNKILFQKNA